MKYTQHRIHGTGFHATPEPQDGLPIIEAGEIWAPRHWSIQTHTHAGWELYLQVKGRSLWEFQGERHQLREQGAYLVKSGVEHRLVRFCDERSHFYYVVFETATLPASIYEARCWQTSYSIFQTAHLLLLPLQGIIGELAICERWQPQMCESYLTALCTGLARLSEEPQEQRALGRHPAAERAMRLLNDRLDHPWQLEELARLSGASVPHLIEIFRREYGQTPMRTLLSLRLEDAHRQLQQTEKSVTDIALDLGFASSQHLARTFKQAYGKTPTATRGKRAY